MTDTMRWCRCGDGAPPARVHGSHLADPPSADVPSGQTITLAEWLRQQEDR